MLHRAAGGGRLAAWRDASRFCSTWSRGSRSGSPAPPSFSAAGSSSALLAITPLVVPALVGFRAAAGGFSWVEAWLANALLGTDLEPPTLSPAARGFWGRAEGVARDGAFWRQQAYLLQGFVLRGALAICEVTLLAAGAMALAVPVYYRWNAPELGSWHADSFERALLFVPAGIAALALGIYLLGPLGTLSRRLAESLLRGNADAASDAAARASRRRGLKIVAEAAAPSQPWS